MPVLSETGECLEVASPFGIPDNFKLIIRPEILTRSCEVAWRSALQIGVRKHNDQRAGPMLFGDIPRAER